MGEYDKILKEILENTERILKRIKNLENNI